VTASDVTPELLEVGRRRAEVAGVELRVVEADAEHLPCDDESYASSCPRSAHEWNRGTTEHARFEMEYLIAVGTRA